MNPGRNSGWFDFAGGEGMYKLKYITGKPYGKGNIFTRTCV